MIGIDRRQPLISSHASALLDRRRGAYSDPLLRCGEGGYGWACNGHYDPEITQRHGPRPDWHVCNETLVAATVTEGSARQASERSHNLSERLEANMSTNANPDQDGGLPK